MRKNVGKKKLLLTVLSALTLSLAATIGAFADESDTSKPVSYTHLLQKKSFSPKSGIWNPLEILPL